MSKLPIERRLFDAVLIVLASAGCQPPPASPRIPSDDSNVVLIATPADAGVAVTDGGAAPTPVDAVQVATVPDANALCEAYKRAHPVDTKKLAAEIPPGGQIRLPVYWDAHRGVATCSVARASKDETIEVSRTAECCHMSPGPDACKPYKVKEEAVRVLVETAELNADGTVAKTQQAWQSAEKYPRERHNCGRRPEGLHIEGERCTDVDAGTELAHMAELEAASVPAFDRLARELTTHGAPSSLVHRAKTAKRDEIRHARVMTALAARYGATPRAIHVDARPCRSLEAIAIENAIEGCVREAYGALVATYQAATAAPELRAAFERIAHDERRHAALSEDVDAWLHTQLDDAARARVTAARHLARRELRTSLADTRGSTELGLPAGPDAIALFDAYFAAA